MKPLKIDFLSDSIAQPIIRRLYKISPLDLEFLSNDINQHFQKLHTTTAADLVILNVRADFFLRRASPGEVESFTVDYVHLVDQFSQRNKALIVLNTVEYDRKSFVDQHHLQSILVINEINRKLIELSLRNNRVVVVDVAGALHSAGLEASISIQNDMVMKMPYKKVAIEKIASVYAKAISQHYLPRKKVVVLDADNTLWGGIVGEDGIHGVQVDESFPGSVYREFQTQLLRLRDSGLLLALVSKNNEQDVMEMFCKINMPLKWEDFTTTRVNWDSKSKNIESIAEEINVGLDSLVFIDDNPFEINEVQHSLPMVDCYHFDGKKPDSALAILHNCRGLTAWSVTEEDLRKSEQYQEESQRKMHLSSSASLDEYLHTLQIRMQVGVNRSEQIKRISQLTNKTNQFNLTTKRYSELDVEELMSAGKVYDFRILDRYGDMGIVGVVIVKNSNVDTMLMSCRALGREVESTILKIVCEDNKTPDFFASYTRTAKNSMVENFFEKNGFDLQAIDGGTKLYKLGSGPNPKFDIKIEKV
jgi:FkbH-like protein